MVLVGIDNVILSMWMDFGRSYEMLFKCHKSLWFSSFNTNWFSDEKVKDSIQQYLTSKKLPNKIHPKQKYLSKSLTNYVNER